MFGECVRAWLAGDESAEARVGSARVGQILNLIEQTLTAKPKGKR